MHWPLFLRGIGRTLRGAFTLPRVAAVAGLLLTLLAPVQAQPPGTGPRRDLVVGPPVGAPDSPVGGQSAGMFVGVNEFDDEEVADLSFAVNDAVALAHRFVIEQGLVAPQNTFLVLSGTPTTVDLQQKLAALRAAGVIEKPATFSVMRQSLRAVTQLARDLLIVTVASHGFTEDGIAYVLPRDGTRVADEVAATSLPLTLFESRVSESRAPRRIVLLDACRSKMIPNGRSISGVSEAFQEAFAQVTGTALLQSASLGETSWEDMQVQHGVFTYQMLQALADPALADAAGIVRLGPVFARVSDEVRAYGLRRGREQTPVATTSEAMRRLPIAQVRARSANPIYDGLLLPPSPGAPPSRPPVLTPPEELFGQRPPSPSSDVQVTVNVFDANNDGDPGVVVSAGNGLGGQTDIDGQLTLTLPGPRVRLVVSRVGDRTGRVVEFTVPAGQRAIVDVRDMGRRGAFVRFVDR